MGLKYGWRSWLNPDPPLHHFPSSLFVCARSPASTSGCGTHRPSTRTCASQGKMTKASVTRAASCGAGSAQEWRDQAGGDHLAGAQFEGLGGGEGQGLPAVGHFVHDGDHFARYRRGDGHFPDGGLADHLVVQPAGQAGGVELAAQAAGHRGGGEQPGTRQADDDLGVEWLEQLGEAGGQAGEVVPGEGEDAGAVGSSRKFS